MLYEALTGVNPVSLARGARGPARASTRQHLPPLRRQRRELPRELGQAIDLALRPRPRERGTVDELRAVLERASELVSDRPGVVQDAWPTRSTPSSAPATAGARRRPRRPDAPDGADAPGRRHRAHRPANGTRSDGTHSDGARARRTAVAAAPPPRARLLRRPTRAWGAAGAAALAAWVVGRVLASAPMPAAAPALLAALAVVLLPRLGWIVLSRRRGDAAQRPRGARARPSSLRLGALLPAAGCCRARRCLAARRRCPAAGRVRVGRGVAGRWPARRAAAGSAPRSARLGWVWVLLGGALTGRRSLYGADARAHGPAVWRRSAPTLHQALAPIAAAPACVAGGARLGAGRRRPAAA